MKTKISTAFVAAAILLSNIALADDEKPIELTAAQMDVITAGTGRDNVAEHAWAALFAAGLTPMHNAAADGGVIDHAGFNGVLIPLNPNKP